MINKRSIRVLSIFLFMILFLSSFQKDPRATLKVFRIIYWIVFQQWFQICHQKWCATNPKTNIGIQSRKFRIQGSRSLLPWSKYGIIIKRRFRIYPKYFLRCSGWGPLEKNPEKKPRIIYLKNEYLLRSINHFYQLTLYVNCLKSI